MKSRQFNVKVLEVYLDNEKEFKCFFKKNHLMFKSHLISINGNVSSNVKDFLESLSLNFIINTKLEHNSEKVKVNKDILKNNLKVIDKIIRSGSEIIIDSDLLLLNRVNSGAKLIVDGNLIVTKVVEGSIYCNGNFMMIKASPKAKIFFNGVEVDNSYLKDELNRIELKNDDIQITPVLKKEITWV